MSGNLSCLMSPSYRFAKQPMWLVGHFIAMAAIVLFVVLGLWQLDRHDERRALDAKLTERIELDPVSFEQAMATPVDELELRLVAVSGTYVPDEEVILQARSFSGRSGHNVVTPLVTADGTAVLINRGWVPIDIEGPPVVGAEALAGTVNITGVARKTEVRGNLGPVDPASGNLDRISRVDIDRLSSQVAAPLARFYLQLVEPVSAGEFPLVLPPPEAGGGPPHLSYAVQWFLFAAVVAVGYPILLRTNARKAD